MLAVGERIGPAEIGPVTTVGDASVQVGIQTLIRSDLLLDLPHSLLATVMSCWPWSALRGHCGLRKVAVCKPSYHAMTCVQVSDPAILHLRSDIRMWRCC